MEYCPRQEDKARVCLTQFTQCPIQKPDDAIASKGPRFSVYSTPAVKREGPRGGVIGQYAGGLGTRDTGTAFARRPQASIRTESLTEAGPQVRFPRTKKVILRRCEVKRF